MTDPPLPSTASTPPLMSRTPPAGRWRQVGALLSDLVRLARPTHWVKNLVVIPLALLSLAGPTAAELARLGWAVLAFCLASSAVYVWNDIADRHRDRAHPVKRHRPVAAGRVHPFAAGGFAVTLTAALLLVMLLGPSFGWWPLLVYLGLNIAYSRGLKQVPLLDMFVVAAGFGLRLIQGHVAVDTTASSWLLIAVFAICLLLILGKRRHEVGAAGTSHRPSLAGYSPQFLEYLMILCGAVTVTAGLLYLSDASAAPPHADAVLLLSVPLAIFGLARYLQLVVVRSDGGDPVRLLRDPVILVTALLWIAAVATIVTLPEPALAAPPSP
ncbi:UbiA prenyltransferase family protein [Natronosporangium hydrolyticum]|uniref:UbiA prenyltransferase family protein n=1 Tax=Natronosporangium hydrolyticum TaxID=2811111 RepID=A0A895YFE3_9ACTN|nr:UbiA prenyltransferase family protein [Natronosporangium hydrolyticum]QSB12900.1 UbiA prenyltransferase family protein [Natronosporangium hydrolyticum]